METTVESNKRDREDVLFDSIIWHLRNSVNNGKQHLSGGDCEAYFRELVKKVKMYKPVYPKTYEECCDVLGYDPSEDEISCYKSGLIDSFVRLLICRNAYWKIASEQMGLGKPWKPDWKDETQVKYMITTFNNELEFFSSIHSYVVGRRNHILSFPTEEMRNAFYENFKNLIEQCK